MLVQHEGWVRRGARPPPRGFPRCQWRGPEILHISHLSCTWKAISKQCCGWLTGQTNEFMIYLDFSHTTITNDPLQNIQNINPVGIFLKLYSITRVFIKRRISITDVDIFGDLSSYFEFHGTRYTKTDQPRVALCLLLNIYKYLYIKSQHH